MEESETLISEREIPRLLIEYQAISVNNILNNQLPQGLEILTKSQELVEAALSQEALVSPELLVLINHTYALYYHQSLDTVNEILSLCKTISLFKKYVKSLETTLVSKPSHRIFKARILLKLHLQLLSAYCKAESFEDALHQARSALRRSQNIIQNSLRACQEHMHRHKLISQSPAKNQQYVLLESPHYQLFHSIVSRTMPVLQFLNDKTQSLSKIPYQIPNLKFSDTTKLHPWNYETLVKGPEIMEELETELMMEKIVIHISCHYFLGNLLKKVRNDQLQVEAGIMFKRAWRICKQFLTENHPMFLAVVKQLKTNKSPIKKNRSSARIKTPSKMLKSEQRSLSSNKIQASPSRKLNKSCRDLKRKDGKKRR